MSIAKAIEFNIPWMHLPNELKPYTSGEFMFSMAFAYLVIITVGSFLMKGKRVRMNC